MDVHVIVQAPYALETGPGALRGSLILPIFSCTEPTIQPCVSSPLSDVRRWNFRW